MFKHPIILITEKPNSTDYYGFSLALHGKDGLPDIHNRIYTAEFNNDGMQLRGKYGTAHQWILKKASWLCTQLNIPTTSIKVKYSKASKYRKLNKTEHTYL